MKGGGAEEREKPPVTVLYFICHFAIARLRYIGCPPRSSIRNEIFCFEFGRSGARAERARARNSAPLRTFARFLSFGRDTRVYRYLLRLSGSREADSFFFFFFLFETKLIPETRSTRRVFQRSATSRGDTRETNILFRTWSFNLDFFTLRRTARLFCTRRRE